MRRCPHAFRAYCFVLRDTISTSMGDIILLIGSVIWGVSLLFLVFSIGVAILSFSALYLFVGIIFFGVTSGFMVACAALKD